MVRSIARIVQDTDGGDLTGEDDYEDATPEGGE